MGRNEQLEWEGGYLFKFSSAQGIDSLFSGAICDDQSPAGPGHAEKWKSRLLLLACGWRLASLAPACRHRGPFCPKCTPERQRKHVTLLRNYFLIDSTISSSSSFVDVRVNPPKTGKSDRWVVDLFKPVSSSVHVYTFFSFFSEAYTIRLPLAWCIG